jgi:hypothetical protein
MTLMVRKCDLRSSADAFAALSFHGVRHRGAGDPRNDYRRLALTANSFV